MNEPERWIVKCQDSADGTGDVIVDLPDELVAALGLSVDDVLTIEKVEGTLVLKPIPTTRGAP